MLKYPPPGGDSGSRQTDVELLVFFARRFDAACFRSCGGSAQEIADSGGDQNSLVLGAARLARPGAGNCFFVELNWREPWKCLRNPKDRRRSERGARPLKPPPQLPDRTPPGNPAAASRQRIAIGRSFPLMVTLGRLSLIEAAGWIYGERSKLL